MAKQLIIIGAGGHAKVVTDILIENGEYDIAGYIDCDLSKEYREIRVLGEDSVLPLLLERGIGYAFIAIGDNDLREKLQRVCIKVGYQIINVISRHSVISPSAIMGTGNVIMDGAVIHASTVIGDGCIINTNASVDHDCIIGDYCHIAPGTAVSGFTSVGKKSFLGTGSRVIDKIVVGECVILGAGGVVVKNTPSNVKMVGIPARVIKNMK